MMKFSYFVIPYSLFLVRYSISLFSSCYFFSYIGLVEQALNLTVALEMLNRIPGAQECDATGVK